MKRAFIVFVLLMFCGTAYAATYNGFASPTIVIDGEAFVGDVPPIIVDGRTLAPVRALAERLGYEVGWDQEQQLVTLESPQSEVEYDEMALRVQDLEKKVKQLEDENASLRSRLGLITPPADIPVHRFGETIATEAFDITVTAMGITPDPAHVVYGDPYALSLAFRVQNKVANEIPLPHFTFDLGENPYESDLNNKGYWCSEPSLKLSANAEREISMKWHINDAKLAIAQIQVVYAGQVLAVVVP